MFRIAPSLFILFSITSFSIFANQNSHEINLESFWNKPRLVVDNDAVCSSLLEDVNSKFYGNFNWGEAYGIRGYGWAERRKILDWKMLGEESDLQIEAYGKTYYTGYYKHNGCGGACERNQPLVSTSPIPIRDWNKRKQLAKVAPPEMSYSHIYAVSNEGIPYLFTIGETSPYKGKLFSYRLSPEALWVPACEIDLDGEKASFDKSHQFNAVQNSINELYSSTLGMSQGGGYTCGSMDTRARWRDRLLDKLMLTLYRPWAIERSNDWPSENSYGDYKRIIKDLERWSLMGVTERKVYLAYKEKLSQTVAELSSFYQQNSLWNEQESKNMAEHALQSAVSYGFGFYRFDLEFSAGEEALRRAILENKPLAFIKTIGFEVNDIDAVTDKYSNVMGKESVLTIAIDRPDVLEYLLEKGVSPNTVNGFGKTPLMYAAQLNVEKAVKLLIDYGSNTIATTTIPSNRCFYTLSTYNITPLHYAVRYASADVIKLLLNSGAEPSMKVDNHRNFQKIKETPLDWLRKYTGENSQELNKNIKPSEIKELASLLAIPSDKERLENAKFFHHKAIEEFKKENFLDSYRHIRKAVHLNPDNEQALSDLSLISLRNNQLGHSASVSNRLIKHSEDKQILGNAWFNYGLACQKQHGKAQLNLSGYTVFYNGYYYCDEPNIQSFINAWSTEPTEARKNKILSFFDDKLQNACRVNWGKGDIAFRFRNNKILILYRKGDSALLADVFTMMAFESKRLKRTEVPRTFKFEKTNTYELEEFEITEIDSPFGWIYLDDNANLSCDLIKQ